MLNPGFHASKPLQKAASDITYIKYRGRWFYLVCFLDLFNNEIVEWQLSDSFDNLFVIQSAKRLLEKAKCTDYPILLHSDQGNQYTSAGYQALLREYNAIQSMSRAGTPRDNAVMEHFFGRFKDVLRFQYRSWEHDDLTTVISDASNYFNTTRPLRKLKGKPPVPFRIEQVAFCGYYLLTVSPQRAADFLYVDGLDESTPNTMLIFILETEHKRKNIPPELPEQN